MILVCTLMCCNSHAQCWLSFFFVQVHSVPLFHNEDIRHELLLIVSQPPDENQVIIWGARWVEPETSTKKKPPVEPDINLNVWSID